MSLSEAQKVLVSSAALATSAVHWFQVLLTPEGAEDAEELRLSSIETTAAHQTFIDVPFVFVE
jgi:hypothetical protein